MNDNQFDYSLFQKFIETYSPRGFRNIDRTDRLICELEKLTEKNNQYYFIADLFQGKILFTSKRSIDIIGIEADELTPYHAIEAAHPDDVHRNTKGWATLLDMGNDLLKKKDDKLLLSTNMRIRNPHGSFSDILFQCYLFYCCSPNNTVYDLQIHTNIDGLMKRKNGFHYYSGSDISNFKYPDEKLLAIGNPFSEREFEIIQLIEMGCSSDMIAEKLFISINTVNTHRRNIIAKSGKSNFTELLHDLQVKRLL